MRNILKERKRRKKLFEEYKRYVRNEVFTQGIVASGIMVVIIAWCIKRRGPLFVSIFSPLQLVLVDIAAYFMLDEKLYVGRYFLNLTLFSVFHVHDFI